MFHAPCAEPRRDRETGRRLPDRRVLRPASGALSGSRTGDQCAALADRVFESHHSDRDDAGITNSAQARRLARCWRCEDRATTIRRSVRLGRRLRGIFAPRLRIRALLPSTRWPKNKPPAYRAGAFAPMRRRHTSAWRAAGGTTYAACRIVCRRKFPAKHCPRCG